MAKVKSGGIRNLIGRVGGNVYYMNKGQNIARELAPAISNPQTAAQQEQRMRWANLVSFYRVNLPWMKRGAFESKKQTWSDYNAFVSANSKISPVYLTKGEAEQGAAVVAPYTITKGSLPSIGLVSDETNEQFVSDLFVGDLVISGTTTAAQLSAALLANNNGLQESDQISFILNLQSSSAQSVPFITARYYEFIIDSSDNRTLADLGLNGVIIADTWEGNECLCLVHGGATCGGAIILSRTTSGNIKVSTQSLVLNAAAIAYLANYTSDAALQRAAQSYGENEANFLAAGYSGKASNVAVPTGISVLGVTFDQRPVTLGSRFPNLQDSDEVSITLSEDVTGKQISVTATGKDFAEGGSTWQSGAQIVAEVTSSQGSNLDVMFTDQGAAYIGIESITITIDGQSIVLRYAEVDPDVAPV